ncbi:MAG: SURF1 family protein, partial [Acidimicrobiales bacterium]|nr:SURF1 family protein [Acidimicrobiales bacterium]
MFSLGLWQLDRLGERRDRNREIAVAIEEPVRPFADVVAGSNSRYARVTISGTYRPDGEALVGNRTLDGAPGFWVLGVLDTEAGPVAVLRGFANRSLVLNDSIPPPPPGEQTIAGYVEYRVDGVARQNEWLELNRPDTRALAEALGLELPDEFVVADVSTGGLVAVERPPIGDGPHLSYAVQWFIFATIAGVGYIVLLRRMAQTGGGTREQSDSLRP